MDWPKIKYVDDDTMPIKKLFRMRASSLFIGLILGTLLSFTASRFEEVLSQNVQVVFFIPFIVYMASAIGMQTQSIYIRDLKTGNANFQKYLFKESVLGFLLGAVYGTLGAIVTWLWFQSNSIALTVGLSLFCAILIAPTIALLITEVLHEEHKDPALGAGPIATVVQDALSILIYGLIASAIIL